MDAVLFTLFVHILTVENRMGWGMFGDPRFIVFGFGCTTLFLLFHLLALADHNLISRVGKFLVVAAFILTTIIGVGGSYIQVRHVNGTTLGMNDAGLQNEIGGKLLLLGKNPYTEKYFTTDLAKAPYNDEMNNTINPALYYFAYPPFAPILTAGTFRILAPRLGWFDVRVIYLTAMLFLLVLGYFKWGFSDKYLLYLILIGCNPYFVRSTVEGSNDVVAILLLVLSILLLEKKRLLFVSGILFGLALASKQIIWPAIPFFLYGAWQQKVSGGFIRVITGSVLALILTFGPFIVWDFQGLINGLLLYHSGNLPHSYPIHNFGFGIMLWQMGVVKSIYDYYPFGLWQVGGIVLVIAIVWFVRKNLNPGQLIVVGWTGCLFIIFLFNRALNYSYLGIMEVAVALTVLWYSENPVRQKVGQRGKII